jgi:hypothetical protein
MSLADAIAVAFLSVSLLSLAVQSWALHKLRVGGIRGDFYRTVWCRVGCAVLYVLVGANALWLHLVTLQTSFVAYFLIQVTWIANSRLDVRHGHNPPHQPKHRL